MLLIDGDLRKPRIHQYLGVVKTNGLTTVLSNQMSAEEVVFKSLREGLDVITSGSIPPNPAELLSSDAMGELLDQLKEQYDYIFFDTPPVTVVTDAAALSKYVDGLVLIVREGYTNHESIEHAINLLNIADAKILGFFVNDVEPSGNNYGVYRTRNYGGRGYGYRYRYNYRYNYRYGSKEYGEKVEMNESETNMIQKNRDNEAENMPEMGAVSETAVNEEPINEEAVETVNNI